MAHWGSYWDDIWITCTGCRRCRPGCVFCWAEFQCATLHRDAPLYAGVSEMRNGVPHFTGVLRELAPDNPHWDWPRRYPGADKPVMGDGKPSLIYTCIEGDMFAEGRPDSTIDRTLGSLAYSRHVGLILTRRVEAMREYFGKPGRQTERRKAHLWVGYSVENQFWFDHDWPHLRALAEAGWTTWVSLAPLLGPIKLPDDFLAFGDRIWVVVGGEQKTRKEHVPRHMDPDWARALLAQCREAGVPFHLYQMADRADIPADLYVREFPRVRKA